MLLDIPRLRSPKLPPSFKYWLKRLHVWEKLDFSGKLTDISDELAILVVFNQLRSGNPQAKINFKNKTSALQLTLQNWIGEVVLLDDQSVFVRRKRLICWLDTRNNNIFGVLFKPVLGLAASEGGCAFYILLPLSLFFIFIFFGDFKHVFFAFLNGDVSALFRHVQISNIITHVFTVLRFCPPLTPKWRCLFVFIFVIPVPYKNKNLPSFNFMQLKINE